MMLLGAAFTLLALNGIGRTVLSGAGVKALARTSAKKSEVEVPWLAKLEKQEAAPSARTFDHTPPGVGAPSDRERKPLADSAKLKGGAYEVYWTKMKDAERKREQGGQEASADALAEEWRAAEVLADDKLAQDRVAQQARFARGDTVILAQSDSNDSKITV
jgi:hypothetical protein